MLSELRLRNFKAFGDKEQKAPMSKITLIYGPNSGGKSSIIQALLMLKQSLAGEWSRDSSRRELMSRGEYVDLGSFFSLLHKHNINRKLGIGVTFNNSYSTKFSVNLTSVTIEDSSSLSEVGYQILDGNKVILDAKLEYDTNSWDTSQLSIAGMNGSPEIFPRTLSFSGKNFLPRLKILGIETTQRILHRRGTELEQELILAQELEREWDRAQKMAQELESVIMELERVAAEKKREREKIIKVFQERHKQELVLSKKTGRDSETKNEISTDSRT